METTTPGPAGPPRPVFAASYLFAGVGALALVAAVGAFFAIPEFSHQQSQRAGEDTAGTVAAFALLAHGGLAIGFAGLCVLLAVLDARGRGAARVLTWVLGGLALGVNATLLAVGAYGSVPWYRDLTRIVAVSILLLVAASVVLLALPASHRYFRAARAARLALRPRRGPVAPPGYRPPPRVGPGWQSAGPGFPPRPGPPPQSH